MTNLPITISAQQTTATSKQAANTAETGDTQNSQPFGNVLARQINAPTAKDAKVDGKHVVDVLAQLGIDSVNAKKNALDSNKKDTADTKKAEPAITGGAVTLPTDMLAALLPQAMNNAVTTNAAAASAGTKSDSPAITANMTQDKQGVVSLKTDVVAGIQAKEQSFAAALTDSASRASESTGLNAAARDAISAQTGPQSNAAAVASLQNTAASIAAPVIQPVQITINTPVNQNKWGDEFSQKITWIASSNKDQTAELHLNPPQLGPVDVVIKVSGDQATALFTSPHAAVRDAIEQAMPKLRDMLADNGIMLGNATVSDQAPRDQGQSQSNMQRSAASTDNDILTPSLPGNSATRVSQISLHNGIVDTFA